MCVGVHLYEDFLMLDIYHKIMDIAKICTTRKKKSLLRVFLIVLYMDIPGLQRYYTKICLQISLTHTCNSF